MKKRGFTLVSFLKIKYIAELLIVAAMIFTVRVSAMAGSAGVSL